MILVTVESNYKHYSSSRGDAINFTETAIAKCFLAAVDGLSDLHIDTDIVVIRLLKELKDRYNSKHDKRLQTTIDALVAKLGQRME